MFRRHIDGSDPLRAQPVTGPTDIREDRHAAGSSHLATGTLACPRCDAPVALTERRITPAHDVACPFCDHAGAVRDFLSLGIPTRPTRVELHVVRRTVR
jgi:hypothetical protein